VIFNSYVTNDQRLFLNQNLGKSNRKTDHPLVLAWQETIGQNLLAEACNNIGKTPSVEQPAILRILQQLSRKLSCVAMEISTGNVNKMKGRFLFLFFPPLKTSISRVCISVGRLLRVTHDNHEPGIAKVIYSTMQWAESPQHQSSNMLNRDLWF